MIEAQKIACANHAGFVMSFVAQTQGAKSLSTGNYPINQTEVIDLGTSAFRPGLEFWPLVDAVLGKTEPSHDHIIFAMNGQTATYEVKGTTLDYSVKLVEQPSPGTLPDFPANVPLNQYPFTNWAGDLTVPNLWTCAPQTPEDVVAVCNWASSHAFRVRARGVMHGWSPLSVTEGMSNASVLLVDLTKSLWQVTFIAAANGQPPNGARRHRGHHDRPAHIPRGATRRHGSRAGLQLPPYTGGWEPHRGRRAGDKRSWRGGADATGRQFLFRLRLHEQPRPGVHRRGHGSAVPNARAVHAQDLHAGRGRRQGVPGPSRPGAPGRGRSGSGRQLQPAVPELHQPAGPHPLRAGRSVDVPARRQLRGLCQPVRTGRFPFTTNPWLHVWQVSPEMPTGSRQVQAPYNYPFADNLDATLQSFLKNAFGAGGLGGLTPEFGSMMFTATDRGLDGKSFLGTGGTYPVSRDIWGSSKDVLLYIEDTTLKVTANGYAVQMRKADLQQAVHDFTTQFSAMLATYRGQSQYPVNSAMEIRVTGLDDPTQVAVQPGMTAASPVVSSLTLDQVAIANQWDVALWLDVLTIPGTPNSNQFYQELEEWLLQRFSGTVGRVLPEWSKGWAYSMSFV